MLLFIIRRFFTLLITLFLVSIFIFAITEASPGNVARNVLGAFITPEQEESFLAQMGMDKPVYVRYLYWLFGSDFHARAKVGLPLVRIETEDGFYEWWGKEENGKLIHWRLEGDDLIAVERDLEGNTIEYVDNERWSVDEKGISSFWGVDSNNSVVLWEKGSDRKVWTFVVGTGWMETSGGPVEYIPLKKGFIRGDPGISLRTGRPVSKSLFVRFRNSLVLAGIAFVIVIPPTSILRFSTGMLLLTIDTSVVLAPISTSIIVALSFPSKDLIREKVSVSRLKRLIFASLKIFIYFFTSDCGAPVKSTFVLLLSFTSGVSIIFQSRIMSSRGSGITFLASQ